VRRREAVVLVAAGLACVAGGLTWMFHGWGLVGMGAGLALGGLFFDFRDDDSKGGAQ